MKWQREKRRMGERRNLNRKTPKMEIRKAEGETHEKWEISLTMGMQRQSGGVGGGEEETEG